MNRKWLLKLIGLAAGVAIFAAACTQAVPDGDSDPTEFAAVPTDEVAEEMLEEDQRPEASGLMAVEIDPSEYELVYKLAQEDLARRLELNADSILFLTIERVLWGDTSLGNPEPDMAYADVEIPGFKLVLFAQEGIAEDGQEAIGQAYLYHTTTEEEVVFVGETEVPPQSGALVVPDDGTVVFENPNQAEPIDEPVLSDIEPSEYTELVKLAVEDLGRRFDLDPDEIRLERIAKVEWPDSSLGAPEPDTLYAQVITPGFKMVLEAQNELYCYHTSLDRVVLVESFGEPFDVVILEPEPLPEPADNGPAEEEVLRLGREDLGKRLGLNPDSIILEELEAVRWPNTALGNPEPDVAYAEIIVPGFIMILKAEELLYRYHTSLDRVVLVAISMSTQSEPAITAEVIAEPEVTG